MTRGLALLAVVLSACTLEAGGGFATMESGELEVQLDRASARISGSTFVTDLGYEVELERFELEVRAVELQELLGGGALEGGGSFDPASPPPGFTLCHGGHCHSEEGELVSYEEIQAMLTGGAVRYEPLVSVPLEATVDVLAAEVVALDRFEPSRELPRGAIARIFVPVDRVRIGGQARGGSLGASTADLAVDAAVSGGFVATVNRPVDRSQPETIELSLTVPVGGALFDGTDFATETVDEAGMVGALLGADLRVDFD